MPVIAFVGKLFLFGNVGQFTFLFPFSPTLVQLCMSRNLAALGMSLFVISPCYHIFNGKGSKLALSFSIFIVTICSLSLLFLSSIDRNVLIALALFKEPGFGFLLFSNICFFHRSLFFLLYVSIISCFLPFAYDFSDVALVFGLSFLNLKYYCHVCMHMCVHVCTSECACVFVNACYSA